jgi:hypothetical protein
VAISRIRPVITERAVLRYCGKFTLATLATLSVMTGLIQIELCSHLFQPVYFFVLKMELCVPLLTLVVSSDVLDLAAATGCLRRPEVPGV